MRLTLWNLDLESLGRFKLEVDDSVSPVFWDLTLNVPVIMKVWQYESMSLCWEEGHWDVKYVSEPPHLGI